jgi:IS605 OrfB family transposase
VPYEQALHALVSSHTVEQEEAARIELMRASRAGQLRPLLYSGNRAHDGFLLLRRETDNRYFIYLNLVPETSRFCRLTKVEQRTPSCRRIENLINMRTGEVVSFTSGTGCLFPIEFGRDYQDSEFLRRGSPLSAQLWKRGDRYEVQISFEFKAKQIEPKTILGSDRGIFNLASLAVIDQDGGVIERKNIDGMNLRMVQRAIERKHQQLQRRGKSFTGAARRHAANEAVHVAANAIVGLAAKNHSQVVIENLSGLASTRGKRRRSRFNRILNRAQYQKLQKVLSYKLAVAGLPAAREVHPSYTSQACPFCGSISAENRLKTVTSDGVQTHEFKCVSCGFSDDADLNAARNIALKRLWRDGLSPALRTVNFNEVPENKSFSSFLKFRAERRGERACDRKVGSSGRAGLDAQYEDGEVAPGGNAVEPRSGSNTHASKNLPTMQSAVSPSDENSRPLAKSVRLPDG